jgi:hypothetical protein
MKGKTLYGTCAGTGMKNENNSCHSSLQRDLKAR